MTEPLLLLPGLASDGAAWAHQIAHLADVVRPTVIDLDACTSRREMADAVLAAAPDRFALAGNSMGGWVAQEVAARAPDRVTRLVLVATWTRADPAFNAEQRAAVADIEAGRFAEVMAGHRVRVVHPDLASDAAFMEDFRQMQMRAGPEVVVRHIRAMVADYDTTACLPEIVAPTLVIAARQDPLFPVEENAFIAQRVRDGRLAIVEDSGHAVQMERPQAVTALMRLFLTGGIA